MKLAISNIAWEAGDLPAILPILREAGVGGVEIAPTKLWPEWKGANAAAAREHAAMLADSGFEVPALQSLLFGRPDLKIFGSEDTRAATLVHLQACAEIAAAMGAGTMVFGSPGNRDRGSLACAAADDIATPFFLKAAHICSDYGVVLGLEPNPEQYRCNYLTRWREAERMVRMVDHPGLRLHLDTACIHLGGDDPVEAIRTAAGIASHFHISEPFLAEIDGVAFEHRRIGDALSASDYAGWLSIEMKTTPAPQESVKRSVAKVLNWYPVEGDNA